MPFFQQEQSASSFQERSDPLGSPKLKLDECFGLSLLIRHTIN